MLTGEVPALLLLPPLPLLCGLLLLRVLPCAAALLCTLFILSPLASSRLSSTVLCAFTRRSTRALLLARGPPSQRDVQPGRVLQRGAGRELHGDRDGGRAACPAPERPARHGGRRTYEGR